MDLKNLEIWFVTGSQHLYGEVALQKVAANSRAVVEGINTSGRLPLRVVFKALVTTPQAILDVCREANSASQCVGLVLWMHTFSPAKMWIAGLTALPSRSSTCTRSSIATCPGPRSTWTS